MFLYTNVFEKKGNSWSGMPLLTPFFSNTFMPFNKADNLEIGNLALNNMLIQRDDVSIFSGQGESYSIYPNPINLAWDTDYKRNRFTEYNCNFDNRSTEGGDISFDGEAIEAVVVRRSSSRSNFFIWEDIAIIPITTGSLYTLDSVIYDPYVEHGIEYQYAIQPVGRIGRGAQYETLKNTANFDDIWLIGSDTQQLLMAYNPVVSGYKYIVKDAAIETIGSKYPYVVRNANVGYTQFQFSCTITAHMNLVDGNEVFTPFKDIQILDEYKGIINNPNIGGSSGSVITPSPIPVPPGTKIPETVIENINIIPDSGAPILVDPYLQADRAIFNAGPGSTFPTAGVNYFGKYRKLQVPLTSLPEGVDSTKYWPVGYGPSNPWTEDYLIAYVREAYCKAFDSGALPEQGDRMDNTINTLEEEEVKIRTTMVNLPLETVDKIVSETTEKMIRAAEEEGYENVKGSNIMPIDRLQEPDETFMIEREFRKRVMEFIYDGRPKIFKSPTEGLILVKLTDISLSPNTGLGRMIYDFSCTMTEIGKIDASSLARYGFRESVGDKPIVGMPEEELGEMEVAQLYELFKY